MGDWFRSGINLSQLTDQISTVLNESTAEVQDPATELAIAKQRIRLLEDSAEKQLTEAERLKSLTDDLREQKDASELQIAVISKEYRQLLQTKETDLKDVRSELEKTRSDYEVLLNSSLRQQPPPRCNGSVSSSARSTPLNGMGGQLSAFAPPASSSNGPTSGLDAVDGPGENRPYPDLDEDAWAEDVHDAMSNQTQINHLNQELTKSIAEADHWRKVAQSLQRSNGNDVAPSSPTSSEDLFVLRNEIQALRDTQSRLVDDHQAQLTALQEVHQANILSQQQAHSSALSELQVRLQAAEEARSVPIDHSMSLDDHEQDDGQKSIRRLENLVSACNAENDLLKSQLATLTSDLSTEKQRTADVSATAKQVAAERDALSQEQSTLAQRQESSTAEHNRLVESLNSKLSLLQQQLSSSSQEHDAELLSVREELTTAQRQCSSVNENHAQLQQQNAQLAARLEQQLQDTQRQQEQLANASTHASVAAVPAAPCEECKRLDARLQSSQQQHTTEVNDLTARVSELSAARQAATQELEHKLKCANDAHSKLMEHITNMSTAHDAELMELADERDKLATENEALRRQTAAADSTNATVIGGGSSSSPADTASHDKIQLASALSSLKVAEEKLVRERQLRSRIEGDLQISQTKVKDSLEQHDKLVTEADTLRAQHEAMQQASLHVSEQMKFREAAFEQLRTEYNKVVSSHTNATSDSNPGTDQSSKKADIVESSSSGSVHIDTNQINAHLKALNEAVSRLCAVCGSPLVANTPDEGSSVDISVRLSHSTAQIQHCGQLVGAVLEQCRRIAQASAQQAAPNAATPVTHATPVMATATHPAAAAGGGGGAAAAAASDSSRPRPCQQCAVLRGQLDAAMAQLHTARQQTEVAAHNATDTIQRLQREDQRLKHHLAQKDEEHNRELSELAQRDLALRTEIGRLQQELQSSVTQSHAQQSGLAKELSSVKQAMSAMSAEKVALQQGYLSLQQQAENSGTALARLQLVLEQFQTERDAEIKRACCAAEERLVEYQRQITELREHIRQNQIDEDEVINSNAEVQSLRQSSMQQAQELEVQKDLLIRASSQLQTCRAEVVELRMSRVDKDLVKNLLLSYLSAPAAKRDEALHPIASIFGFQSHELAKIARPKKSRSASTSGWLGGWWGGGGGSGGSAGRSAAASPMSMAQRPFTELFVEFLETESLPAAPKQNKLRGKPDPGLDFRGPLLPAASGSAQRFAAGFEAGMPETALIATLDKQEVARLPLLPTLAAPAPSSNSSGSSTLGGSSISGIASVATMPSSLSIISQSLTSPAAGKV